MADQNGLTVLLFSGGLDSTALAAWLVRSGCPVIALSFDYGQRHGARELAAGGEVAAALGIERHVIRLDSVAELIRGASALTGGCDVPEGHYEAETMRQTVVPGRNLLMLSIALAVAGARGAAAVATAVHAGDHAVYSDCRPQFIEQVRGAAREGMDPPVEVLAPFIRLRKENIVAQGQADGAPFGLSWSCYKGGDRHCGRCGTCVERKEAFRLARVLDPTAYDDPSFAIEAFQ